MQNYKVFINKGLIIFRQKDGFSPDEMNGTGFKTIYQDDFPEIVERIKKESFVDKVIICKQDIEKVFQQFISHFILIEAAGGIVQNQRSDFLMIHRFEKWDFPKGHLETGELSYQGAIREVMEETGLKTVSIRKKAPCTFHIYDFDGQWIVKKTHWYLMKTDYSGPLTPQLEEAILAALWIPHYTMGEYIQQSYPALIDLYEYICQQKLIMPSMDY